MTRLFFTLLTVVLVTGIHSVVATAATLEIFSQEVRVQSTAPGVALIITEFWDKPVEFAFARLGGDPVDVRGAIHGYLQGAQPWLPMMAKAGETMDRAKAVYLDKGF